LKAIDSKRRIRVWWAFWASTALVVGGVGSSARADLRVCTWNLLQFSSSSVGADATRIDAFKLVFSQIEPDVLIVQEISNDNAVALLRDQILNAAGGPGGAAGSPEHYVAATFTNTSDSLDLALFYRDAIFTEIAESYTTLSTAPRHTPRWRIRPLEDPSGAADMYIYDMHLASGDAGQRAAQASAVRADANALPAGSHIIYAGDFNIGSSSEASYQNFVGFQSDNDGRCFDPIDSPGSWSNNAAFTAIHTQSPNADNLGAPGGAVGGGMDDRFDFLLVSSALMDGQNLDYLSGTYRAFGQDGNHLNNDINDPPVIPEGAAVADALHAASDHLPVFMDLSDPTSAPGIALTPPTVVSFQFALIGGTSNADLTVTNSANPPALDLEYSFNPTPDFTVPAGMFVEPAGGGGNLHTIGMNTSTSGNKVRFLEIVNNSGANSPIKTILLSGAVFKHAVPSTTLANQTLAGAIEFSTTGGAAVDETARIFNADFDPILSVPLAVAGATVENDATGRFGVVGFAPVNGVTDFADFTVRFDGVGAAPGAYSADVVFSTADDSALSGAMNLPDVTFALSATVPGLLLGDFNQSGTVEAGDIPGMVSLLLDPAAASETDRMVGDLNQDHENDGLDLQSFIDVLVP